MLLRQSVIFLRERVYAVSLISTLITIPCYWHRRLEAGDLPSHTYNAWLAHLIRQGQAPGLYIVWRWNNILADVALERLGAVFGFIAAERIVVTIAVVVFFWGAFALITAVGGRPPWVLIPAIAMITYGWTFYAGFLNYYISLGLAFFSVALSWRGTRGDLVVALALAFIALLAHPVGFACLTGIAAYFLMGNHSRGSRRWCLFGSAFLGLTCLRLYAAHLGLEVAYWRHFFLMNGVDQLVLFNKPYKNLALVVLVFVSFYFILGVLQDRKVWEARAFRSALEIWVLLVLAAALIPETWVLPGNETGFGFAISRLTSVTAVLGLCLLGSFAPRPWHLAGLAALAAVFFVMTYEDTKILNEMESQVETLVSGLPSGRRVIGTLATPPDSRLLFIDHMIDRACIGKCFSYANYEPSTRQFRIRARPGSPIVAYSSDDSADMRIGTDVVRETDLPVNQIYNCDEKVFSKLCVRELSAGEKIGSFIPDSRHEAASAVSSN